MMIDTSTLPVVDVHCHPFLNQGKVNPEQFTNTVSFGGISPEYMAAGGVTVDDDLIDELQRIKRDVLYFRYMVQQLAVFFDCLPDLDRIIDERNKTAGEDYTDYVRRLYDDCGLTTLVIDFGYPQPPIPISKFIEEIPAEVIPIYRIEPLIAELLDSGCGWDEFRRRYDEAIANALEHEGYRGVKSIIAYRTGLDVSPLSRTPDQGLQALDAVRRGTGGLAMKKLRDHLLCRAMELCIAYDVPMQIHTGMGDFEVNLVRCRPALLMDLLRFPTFRPCRVLLVHAGYPYHAEAGYMAHVLPRVYCDVSEGIPFAGNAARRIISEVLEMAPLSKVVYGSDGYGAPEINYVGAKLGKVALTQALQDLVDAGMLSQGEAEQAAGFILSENARRLYRLDG
ncbi:MAG: amidohydrolase family protein [Anaerolineales bacterium]|nr:amidohydrolase family protein [Anaerolineales bacterium]